MRNLRYVPDDARAIRTRTDEIFIVA